MKVDKKIISLFKKIAGIVVKTVLGASVLVIIFCFFYWYNNRLFFWEAALIWPQEVFSESKFRAGTIQDRSRMAADIIQNNRLLGFVSDKVHEQLGEETGDYYNSDANFTYKLTDTGNADWILTLIPGEDGKIKKVFIRKSCCSISKKILYWSLEMTEPLVTRFLK